MSDSTPPSPERKLETELGPPPEPGAHLGDVIRYYTETAARFVPGWDLELIPLSGKNPRVNGDGWQTLASSDPRSVLDQTKAAGRVNGFGALMNRHIAFDVDHPEVLPPGLAAVLELGMQSSTRPGRTHYIFRVPSGTRFGGSKAKLDPAYGVMGKWGEIKGWNGQIRIWSPNEDGTHVALVPREIPELALVLHGLLLPPLAPGEIATIGELDDWLDEHREARHMAWLGKDIGRLETRMAGASKYEAMNSTVFDMAGSVSAGAYPGRQAYDGLLDEYRELCEADRDWNGERLPKYQDSWRGAVAKWTRDPELIRAAEEKRLKYGADIPWDPEHDESDMMVLEFLNRMRVSRGLDPLMEELMPPEVTDEDIRRLIDAEETGPETRSEGPEALDDSGTQGGESEPPGRDEEPVWTPRMEADEPLTDYARFREMLLDKETGLVLEQLKKRVIQDVAQDEYMKLLKGSRGVVAPTELVLEWQRMEPPEAMVRTDSIGLVYLGGVSHEIVGDAACGKTTLALMMAVQLCRAGETVVWIDFEMGRKRIVNWLMRLGMRPGEVSRFVLLDFIRDEANLADALEWLRGPGADIAGRASVVVVDSLSRAINRIDAVPEGVENSSQAVIQLTDQFISKVCDLGVSTVVLDHTGHMEKHRARGSSAKRQQTDVSYSVEVLVGWSADSQGANLVTSRKDRDGYFVADEPVAVGVFTPDLGEPDTARRPVRVELLPPEETAAMAWMVAREEAKESLRERVKEARREERKDTLVDTVRDVFSALSVTDRKSQNQVIELVKEVLGACRRGDVIDAMNALLARGEVSMEQIGQTYWWSKK